MFFDLPLHLQQPIAIVFPVSSNYPSQEQFSGWASQMLLLYRDGFAWSDIKPMMDLCDGYFLEEGFSLSLDQKRRAATEVLKELVAKNRIVFLPAPFFDPLFEQMMPAIAALAFPAPLSTPRIQIPGKPSRETVLKRARTILSALPEQIDWALAVKVFQSGIGFANEYSGLSDTEKAALAKSFFDEVFDAVDPSRLPPRFILSVIHETADPMIDAIFSP